MSKMVEFSILGSFGNDDFSSESLNLPAISIS
jgi:hypothetical protein